MSDAGFASLNPTLLARKGGAKPAMRPQLAPLPKDVADEQLEDLGWNDMGNEDGIKGSEKTNVIALSPDAANANALQSDSPIVKRQQKDLADRVLADAAMDGPEADLTDEEEAEDEASVKASPVKAKPRKKSKKMATKMAGKGRRAAFTLRLDADRHLKLRLAATMQGVSAQVLVTEALDAMLDQFNDLDALAERMKRN